MSANSEHMRQAIHFFRPGHRLARPADAESFTGRLIRTICNADDDNRERLRAGFPALVWAVRTIQTDMNGYDLVADAIATEEQGPL